MWQGLDRGERRSDKKTDAEDQQHPEENVVDDAAIAVFPETDRGKQHQQPGAEIQNVDTHQQVRRHEGEVIHAGQHQREHRRMRHQSQVKPGPAHHTFRQQLNAQRIKRCGYKGVQLPFIRQVADLHGGAECKSNKRSGKKAQITQSSIIEPCTRKTERKDGRDAWNDQLNELIGRYVNGHLARSPLPATTPTCLRVRVASVG